MIILVSSSLQGTRPDESFAGNRHKQLSGSDTAASRSHMTALPAPMYEHRASGPRPGTQAIQKLRRENSLVSPPPPTWISCEAHPRHKSHPTSTWISCDGKSEYTKRKENRDTHIARVPFAEKYTLHTTQTCRMRTLHVSCVGPHTLHRDRLVVRTLHVPQQPSSIPSP